MAGNIVSGLGVIATVIYAAIQIRSNTLAVRASAFQEVVDSFASMRASCHVVAGRPRQLERDRSTPLS